MRWEVSPEPTAEERDALERALARLLAGPPADPRGAWWREGVREGLGLAGARQSQSS